MSAPADTKAVKVQEAAFLRRLALDSSLRAPNVVAVTQRINTMRPRNVLDGLHVRVALRRGDRDCARDAVVPADGVDSKNCNRPAYGDCECGEPFPRHGTSLSGSFRHTLLGGFGVSAGETDGGTYH